MPKLLLLFINKKKIPWNPRIRTMKQKSYYLLKSAGMKSSKMSAWVLNTHGMGQTGGSV